MWERPSTDVEVTEEDQDSTPRAMALPVEGMCEVGRIFPDDFLEARGSFLRYTKR